MKLVAVTGESPEIDVRRALSNTMKAIAGMGHVFGEFSRADAVLAFGTVHHSAFSAPVVQYVLDGTEEIIANSNITVFQSPALREAFKDQYSERTAVIPCPTDPHKGVSWEPRPGDGVICLIHGPGDGRETFLRAVASAGCRGEFVTAGGEYPGVAACVSPHP